MQISLDGFVTADYGGTNFNIRATVLYFNKYDFPNQTIALKAWKDAVKQLHKCELTHHLPLTKLPGTPPWPPLKEPLPL